MPTESSVIEALRPVQDPELNRSVVDLQMVKSVSVNDQLVRVTVAMPSPEYPLRTELRDRVQTAVSAVPGVGSVAVDLAVMSEDEQKALVTRLQPPGAGGARENPFLTARTRVLAVA
ncbi:MAG TPA: iron-sulfur cluster assembly protein, partial [Acidimicrobiia bacterium]